MRLTLKETGPALLEADVLALERELSARLPADYRGFLLASNGGLLPRNTIHVAGAPWMPTDVYALFGLGRHLDTSDLRWNREIFSLQSLGPSLLPIACDAGGCPFCLILDDGDGAVVYIDLENIARRYFVAASFSAFLERIVSAMDGVDADACAKRLSPACLQTPLMASAG
jgi:hypothetical protein